jgi:hypothetical protein
MILGGYVALEIGSGQAIEKEETSSFMVEFGGGENKEVLVLRSKRCKTRYNKKFW